MSRKTSRAQNVWRPHYNCDDIPGTKNAVAHPGPFADGVVTVNAQDHVIFIPVSGARTLRIRIKHTGAAATLKHAFMRPTGSKGAGITPDPYTANNPPDVALVDGVENKSDITCTGEGDLRLTLTPGGPGVLNYCDIMQIGPENESRG